MKLFLLFLTSNFVSAQFQCLVCSSTKREIKDRFLPSDRPTSGSDNDDCWYPRRNSSNLESCETGCYHLYYAYRYKNVGNLKQNIEYTTVERGSFYYTDNVAENGYWTVTDLPSKLNWSLNDGLHCLQCQTKPNNTDAERDQCYYSVKSKFSGTCDGANFTTCDSAVSKFWSRDKLYEFAKRGCSENLPGEPDQWAQGFVNRQMSPYFRGQNVTMVRKYCDFDDCNTPRADFITSSGINSK
ncbi:Oidioi.mRNA.OKI2018_I69.PAR.g9558.t1.cds [Oikopleura dioica]|uniref:Oidioi.mRNA.OKI2018_I69.PAR.g9558.t1.cds n=1 Tax=Oikopleura dioica TaxID=34765 RepID=A0ABN7RL99_OIKDI|nr:Oidioi.mRNA.OKI2018_I69.PAR.g9558.t1.cds [Oikopleura dioica]